MSNAAAATTTWPRPQEWDFTMSLRVHDPEALRVAALKHADATPEDTFLTEDGKVDIKACLVMLLDPGSGPGYEVHESTAEGMEGEGTDEDDDTMGSEYCTRCNNRLESGQIGECDSCQDLR